MSGLGDIFDFQKYLGGDILKKWKDNPERLLGINTPLETKLWGGITGKDYQPTVDMWGGNTEKQAQDATAIGINTGPGEKMHDIARVIAAYYAGSYGASALGLFGGAGGAGAGAGGGFSMPAAVAETPATLGKWGMMETGPGVFERLGAGAAGGGDFMKYARLGNAAMNMGGGGGGGQPQQSGPPQHQFVGPENPYMTMLRRRMYG
jgi:hypothetical protein